LTFLEDDLPDDHTVAGRSDAALIADITAQAFANDPFNQWVFGDIRTIHATFLTEARHIYAPHGICHHIEGKAATMWMTPNGASNLPLRAMPKLCANILRFSGVRSLRRALNTDAAMQAHKPKAPHLYLFTIGVIPSAQGQGLGHRLLAPMLRAADWANIPIYLENSNPANHKFYAGHGFKSQDMIYVQKDAPPLEAMWREPQN
jgi:ribosomal protein S18 acetylase RimI-like enzyme